MTDFFALKTMTDKEMLVVPGALPGVWVLLLVLEHAVPAASKTRPSRAQDVREERAFLERRVARARGEAARAAVAWADERQDGGGAHRIDEASALEALPLSPLSAPYAAHTCSRRTACTRRRGRSR